jgi:hypothetical protein
MKIALIGFCLILLTLSCGVYTFSPSALGGIKSAAVPVFDNQTTQYGIGELLTSAISQKLVSDNTLKVLPESQADAVIRGTVVSYTRDPYTYTAGETVQQYICRIGVKIKFAKTKNDQTIWEETLTDFGTYDSDTESEQVGIDAAINKLVDQILNKTVKGW